MNIHPEQEYPQYDEWLLKEDQAFLRTLIATSGMEAVREEYMHCLAYHYERQIEWGVL